MPFPRSARCESAPAAAAPRRRGPPLLRLPRPRPTMTPRLEADSEGGSSASESGERGRAEPRRAGARAPRVGSRGCGSEKVAKTPGLSDRNILGCGIVVAGVRIGGTCACSSRGRLWRRRAKLKQFNSSSVPSPSAARAQPPFARAFATSHPSDTVGLGVGARFAQAAEDGSPAAVVDCALLGVARATHGAFVESDPIARERLHLPARANGGGLRSLVQSAPRHSPRPSPKSPRNSSSRRTIKARSVAASSMAKPG